MAFESKFVAFGSAFCWQQVILLRELPQDIFAHPPSLSDKEGYRSVGSKSLADSLAAKNVWFSSQHVILLTALPAKLWFWKMFWKPETDQLRHKLFRLFKILVLKTESWCYEPCHLTRPTSKNHRLLVGMLDVFFVHIRFYLHIEVYR